MSIKIEMMRCFHAVAESGSLAEASDRLGRTPSAVSMMLKQFEDHIGASLFETSRKSKLTPLGVQVLAEARRELEHFDRTVAMIEGLSKAELGLVRLVATPSVAQMILPPVLRRFLDTHQNVQIDLRDMDSQSVHQEMRAERADIGLAGIGPMSGVDAVPLFRDPFGVVCRADHPLAKDWDSLTWSDLSEVSYIANGLCDQIRDPDFRPIRAAAKLSVHNTASLLGVVREGIGVTVLPKMAVPPEFTDLVFLPLVDTAAQREVWLLSQPAAMLTPAARALRDELQSGVSP